MSVVDVNGDVFTTIHVSEDALMRSAMFFRRHEDSVFALYDRTGTLQLGDSDSPTALLAFYIVCGCPPPVITNGMYVSLQRFCDAWTIQADALLGAFEPITPSSWRYRPDTGRVP